ncbi:MAG: glycine--tRNA ligase subunit beta [Candidatus Cloacimonetes bacterium]|nr:glycine--tRNA ligase subunit beta [Candidatus Cloacimonadota bacterium]
MRDFLLEIGIEEVPAPHIKPAVDFILASFGKLARETGLEYLEALASSTPRRFFLIVRQLQETQPDLEVKKTGPAVKIAYGQDGNLLPAALGFLRKNNAQAQDLYTETTEKGEFIALNYTQAGKATADILTEWIPGLIESLPFPKTMIWNSSRLALSRPLRWLCVLWGSDVLELESGGVKSAGFTFGNRWLGLDKALPVSAPDVYLEVLEANAVIADRQARRNRLVAELAAADPGCGLNVIPDERLTDTVVDLVEHPTAVVASFNPEILSLPEKIITSTISQNQKYYSVQDAAGRLSNKFVFISNGDPQCSELIRKGNEKVVAARLADALWYFQEDTSRPLERFLPHLDEVVFQSKLGTMADKTARIGAIARQICENLAFDEKTTTLAERAALLCKADLVTTMLGEKEFTKLQGYIGKQYALASGEDGQVAEAIYEHYQPRGTNDGLPQTPIGAVIAVADKLDSVCGIIGIGQVPTGSADPFALRRAANGVVQIIVERGWNFDFSSLIDFALKLERQQAELAPRAWEDVQAFFRQRVEWLLRQLGLDYDVIDSLMHLALGDLPDLKLRGLALQSFRTREDFLRLVIGFKRVANIMEKEQDIPVLNPSLLVEEEEKALHASLQDLRGDLSAALAQGDHPRAIASLVAYGSSIDSFFDAVLVNCEDPALRGNRHALMQAVKSEFLRVADISRIVIDNEYIGA